MLQRTFKGRRSQEEKRCKKDGGKEKVGAGEGEEVGRRKEEGGRRKEKGGRRKEERERRKEERERWG